tara:strand:- start:104 stop:1567 length:1464 start_codon:yes stop_codon:yes gene_type:complete
METYGDLIKEQKDPITKYLNSIAYKFPKGYPDMNDDQDVLLLESLISEAIGYNFKLNETALTPSVLSQVATLSKNNKVPRIDILIDKIKNNQPLKIEDSEETFIVYDPNGSKVKELENWNQSKGAVRLEDKKGNIISTSKLNKSSDFGGGKGSGAGTTQTGIQESSQCAVSALIQKIGQITAEDLTPENIKSISGDIDTTSSIDEIIEFIMSRDDFHSTFINTGEKLNKYLGDGFNFHRGSDFVKTIYDAWSKIRKENGWSIKDDKWNPSDIWAVKSTDIKFNSDDIETLNNQILDLFEKKQLVGISLKKLGPNPKLTIPIENKPTEEVIYSSSKVSPISKDAYINMSDGSEMQLRTFATNGTSFQGEISGKTAKQGKIGGGIIKTFFDNQNIAIPSSSFSLKNSRNPSKTFIDEFILLANKYGGFNISEEELISKGVDWISSKYQALSIIKAIEENDKNKINKALYDIFGYAKSISSISSIYLKVS